MSVVDESVVCKFFLNLQITLNKIYHTLNSAKDIDSLLIDLSILILLNSSQCVIPQTRS